MFFVEMARAGSANAPGPFNFRSSRREKVHFEAGQAGKWVSEKVGVALARLTFSLSHLPTFGPNHSEPPHIGCHE